MLQQPLESSSEKEPLRGADHRVGEQLSGTRQMQQVIETVTGPGWHLSSAPGGHWAL